MLECERFFLKRGWEGIGEDIGNGNDNPGLHTCAVRKSNIRVSRFCFGWNKTSSFIGCFHFAEYFQFKYGRVRYSTASPKIDFYSRCK